nr:hypothetical protein [uncultured Cohaesibacter sp.]
MEENELLNWDGEFPFQSKNVVGKHIVQSHFESADRPLILSFANRSKIASTIDDELWSYSFLRKIGCNFIIFSCVKEITWFQSNLLQEYMKKLGCMLIERFDVRLGYGESMGAFALLAYSSLFKLHRSLLFAPITTLNSDLVPFEKRWRKEEYLFLNGRYCDVDLNSKTVNYVFYDPLLSSDAKHVARIPNKVQFKMPGSGHGGKVKRLKELEIFDFVFGGFILGYISGEIFCKKIRMRREMKDYYKNLLKRRHHRVTKIREEIILEYQKKFAVENTIKFNASDAMLIRDCAVALEKNNVILAESLMEIAFRIRPDGPFIKRKLSEYRRERLRNHK